MDTKSIFFLATQLLLQILALMDRLLVVQSSRASDASIAQTAADHQNTGAEQMKIRTQMEEDEV